MEQSVLKGWDWREVGAFVFLLTVALFLRLWQLADVPTGLHFDEAIDLKIGLDVANGARPLYVAEGWGREGLYYYILALVLQIVPYNPLALRATVVFCSLIFLLFSYLLVRHWNGRLAAGLTVAFLSVTYWPLSVSRFGVRHISVALLLGITAWYFWHKRPAMRLHHFAVTGILLGLTLYTYQPARFVPFIFALFALYLLLFHRQLPMANWKGWGVMAVSFFLVALPLILILTQTGSSLEVEQRAFTIEPLTELLAGNVKPIWMNTVDTLKAFTFRGDPLQSYNVPERPIFTPSWVGFPFYIGLLLALWRWRQPTYAFALLWLLFMLLPTIVTISAPNFNRMIAAQLPIMYLAALPLAELVDWVSKRHARWLVGVTAVCIFALFGSLTITTWRDYFQVWPTEYGHVHTLNREVTAVVDYLAHESDKRAVVISSRNIADEDPYIVNVSLDDPTFPIHWVDSGQAFAIPVGVDEMRFIVTNDRWIDELLADKAQILRQEVLYEDQFTVYTVQRGDWLNSGAIPLFMIDPHAPTPNQDVVQPLAASYPYAFCHCVLGEQQTGDILLTSAGLNGDWQARGVIELSTSWQTIEEESFASLALFVHLMNEQGDIVAQFDGLGYPPHSWKNGDQFVQMARLALNEELAVGEYWLQFGLYERGTGQRWLLLDTMETPVSDRLILAPFLIE